LAYYRDGGDGQGHPWYPYDSHTHAPASSVKSSAGQNTLSSNFRKPSRGNYARKTEPSLIARAPITQPSTQSPLLDHALTTQARQTQNPIMTPSPNLPASQDLTTQAEHGRTLPPPEAPDTDALRDQHVSIPSDAMADMLGLISMMGDSWNPPQ
jgi:hypothetical protein